MSPPNVQTPGCSRAIAETKAENDSIVGQGHDDGKTLANLRARFALLGHELHVVRKGNLMHFEVRRWGMCRTCSTLHDLEGFLAQLTGAKHGLRS